MQNSKYKREMIFHISIKYKMCTPNQLRDLVLIFLNDKRHKFMACQSKTRVSSMQEGKCLVAH